MDLFIVSFSLIVASEINFILFPLGVFPFKRSLWVYSYSLKIVYTTIKVVRNNDLATFQ